MGTKIGRLLYTHAEPNNIKDPNAVSGAGAKKKNVLTTQQSKGHSQREKSKESWCTIGLEDPCEYEFESDSFSRWLQRKMEKEKFDVCSGTAEKWNGL